MMIRDLFKIFIEEPEKLTKVGLRIINTLFLLIIAEWLYRHFFGNYTLMKLSEYHDWADFILSGRFLIVIACYLIAKCIIETVPNLLLCLIVVRFLVRKNIFKIKLQEYRGLLTYFDILKFGKNNEVPKPGKNIDILYDIANDFKNEEEVKGYRELKDSLLNNILNLYATFLFLYFIFFEKVFHSKTFIFIIAGGFICILFLYLFINSFIELMQKEHGSIVTGIDAIKNHHLIYETLTSVQIKPYSSQSNDAQFFFEAKGKLFALIIDYGGSPFYLNNLASRARRLTDIGRHLFLITNVKFDLNKYSDLKDLENLYTLISYESYADLKEQLTKKVLKKIFER